MDVEPMSVDGKQKRNHTVELVVHDCCFHYAFRNDFTVTLEKLDIPEDKIKYLIRISRGGVQLKVNFGPNADDGDVACCKWGVLAERIDDVLKIRGNGHFVEALYPVIQFTMRFRLSMSLRKLLCIIVGGDKLSYRNTGAVGGPVPSLSVELGSGAPRQRRRTGRCGRNPL